MRAISSAFFCSSFSQLGLFNVLKYHMIPAVPFGEFRFAGGGDALLLEFSSRSLF